MLRPDNATQDVDCAGCTACCRRELVVLQPFESPVGYRTKENINPLSGKPERVLEHRENGDCVYLGEGGCTIYERRPAMCRGFSCAGLVRSLSAQIPRQLRRKMLRDGRLDAAVWDAGSRRLQAQP